MSAERDSYGVPTAWDGRLDILEVAERLFGAEVRDRVWARFGGMSIYVPRNVRPDHPLSDAIGHERALALADEIGGIVVELPVAPDGGWRGRREIVLAGTLEGSTLNQLARELGCSSRRVSQIRAELRAAGLLPPRRGSL